MKQNKCTTMRKTAMALVLCLISTMCFAQGDVIYYSNQSEVLDNITGWSCNKYNGKWTDNKNIISLDKCDVASEEYKSGLIQSKVPNIIDMQAKSVVYNGDEYYCIIVKYWSGEWENPATEKDWIVKQSVCCGYLKKADYENLFKLSTKVTDFRANSEVPISENGISKDDFSNIVKSMNIKYPPVFLRACKSKTGTIKFYVKPTLSYNITLQYFEVSEEEWNKLKIE